MMLREGLLSLEESRGNTLTAVSKDQELHEMVEGLRLLSPPPAVAHRARSGKRAKPVGA